jgi:hypothetical protein
MLVASGAGSRTAGAGLKPVPGCCVASVVSATPSTAICSGLPVPRGLSCSSTALNMMVLLDRFVTLSGSDSFDARPLLHRAAEHDRRRSRHQSCVRVMVSHLGRGSLAAGRPWSYLGMMMLTAPTVLWGCIVTAGWNPRHCPRRPWRLSVSLFARNNRSAVIRNFVALARPRARAPD